MKRNRLFVAVVSLMASATAYAGSIVAINPDAGGPDPTINVSSLGWNNGNAISIPVSGTLTPTPTVGSVIQTYGQSALANFNNSLGNPIGNLGLNSTYEWTLVFGFQEVVTNVTTSAGFPNVSFATIAGGSNFFKIYFGPVDANNLAGTGFTDGTLILSGTVNTFDPANGSGASTFTETCDQNATGTCGALDQNVSNDYPGVTTNSGAGSSFLEGTVTSYDTSFFQTAPQIILLDTHTFQNDPFGQQDPSSCFWNGTALINGVGPNDAGGPCTINTVGAINGFTGPNVVFETRATTDFITKVPEPGSILLLGMGLSALGVFSRRRRT